jgi:hypothetical protein
MSRKKFTGIHVGGKGRGSFYFGLPDKVSTPKRRRGCLSGNPTSATLNIKNAKNWIRTGILK